MTTRERHMSIALIALVIVFGIGFLGFQLIWSPMAAKKDMINSLDRDIADRQAREAQIQKRRSDLKKWQLLSLPPDKVSPSKVFEVAAPGKHPGDNARADLAQGLYDDWLDKTLKASGFVAADIGIDPKKPDAKNAPLLANKKPIYTRLLFAVHLKGDLASLVDFMDRFYKVRLLHQIRDLTITKPLDTAFRSGGANGRAAAPPTDLDVTMTIEALVLDNAEKRTTLLPDKPVEVPPLLARTAAQYAMMPGKNVFFGPISTEGEGPRDDNTRYLDSAPFLRLNGITSGENGWEASLWDIYHNWEYRIESRRTGGYQVTVEYTLGNRKREDNQRSGKTLALRDTAGNIKKEWLVVRIDPRDVILRNDAKGTYFALHMGEYLSDCTELSKSALLALGIKPEPGREIDYDNP